MLTLHFSECVLVPNSVEAIRLDSSLPMRSRCQFYERMLTYGPDGVYSTGDEMCVLIAQWAKRVHRRDVQLVSWCGCYSDNPKCVCIALDEEGDMLNDPWHGFFSQRLTYLR